MIPLLLIIIILIICLCKKENYINYSEYNYKIKDCSKINENIQNEIKNSYQLIQPFGYTKSEYLDKIRFVQTDIPLPTEPDFFEHL
jgi:hypothetical protein